MDQQANDATQPQNNETQQNNNPTQQKLKTTTAMKETSTSTQNQPFIAVNPNRDSPNGYPTVMPTELQPVTLAH